jgi:hypothetical protein
MKVNVFTRRREWRGEGSGDRWRDMDLGEEGGLYASHFQISFQL